MCGIPSPNVLLCLNPLRILGFNLTSYTFVLIVVTEYDVCLFVFVFFFGTQFCISRGSCKCSIAAFESCWHVAILVMFELLVVSY